MKRTALYDRLVARMVVFGGWEMPIQYPTGILEEHLRTRRQAGLFDVSRMGRFLFRGPGALPLLQKVLTNNAAALEPGRAQYTMIPTPTGGALDDAYLYCLDREEYLLVVNAANREKDWDFLHGRARDLAGLAMDDRSGELAMLSLQGPESRRILLAFIAEAAPSGQSQPEETIPEPGRNNLCAAVVGDVSLTIARTGYSASLWASSSSSPLARRGDSGTACSPWVLRRSGWGPATLSAWRRLSPCTVTSWARIPRAGRYPSSPRPWPGSRSVSAH